MVKISPVLFSRVMRLPDTVRTDLLELIGAGPLAESQVSALVEALSERGTEAGRKLRIRLC